MSCSLNLEPAVGASLHILKSGDEAIALRRGVCLDNIVAVNAPDIALLEIRLCVQVDGLQWFPLIP